MTDIALTREQSRQVDRLAMEEYGFSGLVLMENAGRGMVDRLERLGIGGPVAICCGRGNNGGDGFVIARHLEIRGHSARVLLFSDPAKLRGDAAANFQILQKTDVPIQLCHENPTADEFQKQFAGAAWLVDALLGTGVQGEPRPPMDFVIDQMNASGVPILAVDIPSGLDADTGRPAQHTVRAAHTCTMATAKAGFKEPAARQYVGEVHVVNIGTPPKLLRQIPAG